MKKIAALALAALFTVGIAVNAQADTDPKKPVATATSAKKKKNNGKEAASCAPADAAKSCHGEAAAPAAKAQGCASAPAGGSCCSKPAAPATGSGK
jgi:hypothetical protein